MRYGFALDQRTCIGCHACTVACKTEHEIPVGQFRTWVKYVDKGTYPDTTREFGVMRCNHCTDAPCVTACPTQSLFKREDGIVDFDSDRCIGCKACMQACPYDAIYIDANTHTAAKCNFCAHRIDEGIEPACVTVCPTESIWVGDLDDPHSEISRLAATNDTQVRAAEQDTNPQVFYLGADRAVLDPLEAPVGDSYLWAQPDELRRQTAAELPGDPVSGARTTLNTAHPRPWGWPVITYLWTKGVGAGAVLVAAIALALGLDLGVLGAVVAPALGLAGTAITGALLVADLKRPARFLFIFVKPNPRSWLMWGAWVLAVFAGLCVLWLLAGLLGLEALVRGVALPAALGAALTAGYTGFLFGQAEGRDLWQTPLLFWHLIVQAFMVGAGALVIALPTVGLGPAALGYLVQTFVVATAVHLAMLALEYGGRHQMRQAAVAAHMITRGRYAPVFWIGVAVAAVAAVLGGVGWAAGGLVAAVVAGGVLAQAGLLAYESVFVRAPQDVPLS